MSLVALCGLTVHELVILLYVHQVSPEGTLRKTLTRGMDVATCCKLRDLGRGRRVIVEGVTVVLGAGHGCVVVLIRASGDHHSRHRGLLVFLIAISLEEVTRMVLFKG